MREQVAMFRFRLADSQTIGPSELRRLWAEACGTENVSVTRVESGSGYGERGHIYSLWASRHQRDIRLIELEIERLLRGLLPAVTIKLTHLR